MAVHYIPDHSDARWYNENKYFWNCLKHSYLVRMFCNGLVKEISVVCVMSCVITGRRRMYGKKNFCESFLPSHKFSTNRGEKF